jgi:succinylglutamate desuccinylase
MIKVYSKALDQAMYTERIIGKIENTEGPTLIFTGGIHGNEPSGVFALSRVLDKIRSGHIQLKGSMYALCGNMKALEKGRRYLKKDLNRIWTDEYLKHLKNGAELPPESQEQKELLRII